MAYTITSNCVGCDSCRPQCPTGAIKIEDEQFWIDPTLCNNCQDFSEPQCVIACPINSPVPLQAKKGRTKLDTRRVTSPELFSNGKNNPLATAFVIWEACNLLAQRQSLSWIADA